MSFEHCSQLLDSLAPYLDGEASEALCMEIEHHLESCENCRVIVNTLRKTVDLVHHLPRPDLPEGALGRLYKSLDLAGHRETHSEPD
jgi:anti-sigma factor RsiW